MSVNLLETFCPPRRLNMKVCTGRNKENFTDCKRGWRFLSVFIQSKLWQNSRCNRTVRHCVHCAKGKQWQRQFTYHLFSFITGIKTKMLLIIFLGLIANLTLLSGECNVGTVKLRDFDWNKVGVSVFTSFLWNKELVKPLLELYFICGSIKELPIEHIRLTFQ